MRASLSLQITTTVNSGTAGTVIVNAAVLTAVDQTDTEPSNDDATASLTVRGLSIEAATNGVDADAPPGPLVPVGDLIAWTYEVTNLSHGSISAITVTDDQGVLVSCPATTLPSGAAMTCSAAGIASAGQYANLATATGAASGVVSDSDPSHYFGVAAAIAVETSTNGVDADLPPGPAVAVGDPVAWSYVVTNTGNAELSNVTVVDDQGVAVSCPATVLSASAAMTCSASGFAAEGQYSNLGTATGSSPLGAAVQASDPSHYLGVVVALTATKDAALLVDLDGDGRVDPGDTVLYTVVLTNPADALAVSAQAVMFSDTLDPWSALVVGSVTTSQGTVVVGNSGGDAAIEIAVGSIADGGEVTITFAAVVAPGIPATVMSISNQGSAMGANVDTTPTADPAVGGPTMTPIAQPTALEIPTTSRLGLAVLCVLLGAAMLRQRHRRALPSS